MPSHPHHTISRVFAGVCFEAAHIRTFQQQRIAPSCGSFCEVGAAVGAEHSDVRAHAKVFAVAAAHVRQQRAPRQRPQKCPHLCANNIEPSAAL